MSNDKKKRLELLLQEVEKELEQDMDVWLDAAITRLEQLCKSAKGRASIAPRLSPIPEKSEPKVIPLFK